MRRQLRVAVVGAGPAGIYASDILTKAELPSGFDGVTVDLIDRSPTPFGLIRYGVAPDHPRIKAIVTSLQEVLSKDSINFLGNVSYGADVALEELRQIYDAVVFATGARRDRDLAIPGADLEGSFGAADFVSWYDGHPDVPRRWGFRPEAQAVAVIGVGNVGLDIARILAKTADELLVTDIPDDVYDGLKGNATTDVHLFARRGPAQAKFTPVELRELSLSPTIDVIVDPIGFELDEASVHAVNSSKAAKLVVNTLRGYLERGASGAAHRIHIHFGQNPVEILGADGRVTGLRTEVMTLDGTGNSVATGEYRDWPVQAVYRAIGYYSDPLPGLPFDDRSGTVPNRGGQVVGHDGEPMTGVYVTGWIKRGPVGLIGHTKSDAAETIRNLLSNVPSLGPEPAMISNSIVEHLSDRGVDFTTWRGWTRLDAHEVSLGARRGRARVKVAAREEMLRISRC